MFRLTRIGALDMRPALPRRMVMSISRTQASDGRCINPWKGLARRAERLGHKFFRYWQKEELRKELDDYYQRSIRTC